MDLGLIDLPTEVVRTERLVLRPYRPEDVDPVYRACQDPDIQRWRRSMPSPYTEADAIRFVTETTVRARAEGEGLLAAVEADGKFVGAAGLHVTPGFLGPGVGYWTAPWARGRARPAPARGSPRACEW